MSSVIQLSQPWNLIIIRFFVLSLIFSHRQAAKSKEPIHSFVTLTDGRRVGLELESASTSAEVCQAVADDIGLKDTYGFSLYISFHDKVSFIHRIKVSLYAGYLSSGLISSQTFRFVVGCFNKAGERDLT